CQLWNVRRGAIVATADVRILDRVEIDGIAVGVLGPVAGVTRAWAGRRFGEAAVEARARIRDVRSVRAIGRGDRHLPDPEMRSIEPTKHPKERPRGIPVDDELACVRAPVEAEVGNGQKT